MDVVDPETQEGAVAGAGAAEGGRAQKRPRITGKTRERSPRWSARIMQNW